MTSRWAYEALIVHQYKANAYQKHYFESRRVQMDADYRANFYVPELASKLASCRTMIREDRRQEMAPNIDLLRYEIAKQLEIIGTDQLPEFAKLTVEEIDLNTIERTEKFLVALRRFYNNKYNRAKSDEAAITDRLKEQLDDSQDLATLKNHYHNETVEELVLNKGIDRIVEEDGKLVQKIYPIFMLPDTEGIFNFRTQFLVAFKPFLGNYLPTFAFNLMVIWVMTTVLCVLLFYDVLGRLLLR